MYRSILVALDREDETGCRLMAERCRERFAGTQTAIHLAYVRTRLPRSYLQQLPKHWEVDERADAERWLRSLAESTGLSASLAGVHSPSGPASQELTALAVALGVEAICVLAHRIDLGRALLGTSTHAIVRDAPCDVVVLRDWPNSGS
jgi:nucleotide-binding universal stress UspA family protein